MLWDISMGRRRKVRKYHIKHGVKSNSGNWLLCEIDGKEPDQLYYTMVYKDGSIYLKNIEDQYVMEYSNVCQNCIKAALGPQHNLSLFLAKGTPAHIYDVLKNELNPKKPKYTPSSKL